MSHFSTDSIADNAISVVMGMSDHDVKKALFSRQEVPAGDVPKSIDACRDILIDLVYDDLCSVPGPHG